MGGLCHTGVVDCTRLPQSVEEWSSQRLLTLRAVASATAGRLHKRSRRWVLARRWGVGGRGELVHKRQRMDEPSTYAE
jgi:hypothetical protein